MFSVGLTPGSRPGLLSAAPAGAGTAAEAAPTSDDSLTDEEGRFIHEADRANLDADKVKRLLAV